MKSSVLAEVKKNLVSVLMPVFNASDYLEEAIESILLQSFVDFELIIIDDGSIDSSYQIMQRYAKKDIRIKIVTRENKGICFTRNQLLSMAVGKYIAWMDSDDISHSQRLARQVNYLEKNTTCVAVGCMTELIDEVGLKICVWNTPIKHDEIDNWHLHGKGGAIIFSSSMMVRKCVEQVGCFDQSLVGAEDLDLFLRLAELGKIENMEEVLTSYRQHINSISHVAKSRIQQDTQQVVDSARKRRNLTEFKIEMKHKPVTLASHYVKWGWWSIHDKNITTARKYARKAILLNPFSRSTLKLFACSIRGY